MEVVSETLTKWASDSSWPVGPGRIPQLFSESLHLSSIDVYATSEAFVDAVCLRKHAVFTCQK